MKLRITMTRLAKLDLDELIVYVGEESPKAALGVAPLRGSAPRAAPSTRQG